jgi:hypothetical protein
MTAKPTRPVPGKTGRKPKPVRVHSSAYRQPESDADVAMSDIRRTNNKGRKPKRYGVRIKRRNQRFNESYGRVWRGWNWFAPYDYLNKCFLPDPIGNFDPPGSFIEGEVWDWLKDTSAQWYEDRSGVKGQARWEKILERRRLKEVERKLDRPA